MCSSDLIGVRRSVERRACFLERMEITLVVMLGTFEHQMFEQVRKTRTARMLILRSDVIPEIDGHHREPAILMDDHPQAVTENVLRERYVHEIGVSGIGALL